MKRIVGFLKNRWVISIIGLLALAILIWFVGPLVAIAGHTPLQGQVARLIAILVVAILWGLNNLRIQMQVNKANAQMIGGLEEPLVDVGAGMVSAQSAEEVATLKERFDEALQVLKKTSRKKGGAGIYDLPWYIIIGPPGCGKTTALINSGLNFPLAERFGKEALRGVGGTRNCDWWFTEEAVLLDTAGRYVTQDSQVEVDSAAWEGFLTLLKKHRRRRPINGVLVAVSLSDLMLQSEAQRAQHVRAIKQRLQELHKILGIRFPVYVLLTKCDLIAGFMEFFDDLGQEERGQVWGVTFPLEKPENPGTSIQMLTSEVDLLMQGINERVLWRLSQERDPQRRARIFAFPQQLASLREVGNRFLTEIFSPSRYEDVPLLRGVYFSSGTQEGTPIDRIMGALARTFGVGQQALMPHSGQGRSYFLTRLLKDVVFQETELAGANRRLEVQRAWLQRAAYAGAIGLTILAVLAWTTSFTRNQVYVNRFKGNVEAFKEVSAAPPADPYDFRELLPRLTAMQKVPETYAVFEESTPLLMGMGLYQGGDLTEQGWRAYQRELNQVLLPAVRHRLEEHLQAGLGDPDFQYEALKTYLMLGDTEHLDKELLSFWLELDWQNTFAEDAETQGRLQIQLASLLDMGYQPIPLDEDVISNARLSLKQVPLSQLLYGRMKRDYMANDRNPFRISNVTGIAGEKVFVRSSGKSLESGISGLFTYEGYHNYFRKQVKDIAVRSSEENWVLSPAKGEMTEPEIQQLQRDLQKLYFADYIRVWKQMLADIGIVDFKNLRHAAEVLDLLSGPLSPMRSLLQAVERNTSLEKQSGLLAKAAENAGDKVASKNRLARLLRAATESEAVPTAARPAEVVDKQFENLNALVRSESGGVAPIEHIIDMFSQLYGQLDEMGSGLGTDALLVAKGSAGSDIMRRIRVEGARQPTPVKQWMQQVAMGSRAETMGGARAQLNNEWRAAVLPACNQSVSGRYPVVRDSNQEMTLADFGRLFAPGGLMDNYFATHLKSFVDTSRSTWRWKPVGNASLGIPNSVLRQFQRAALIRDTFFAEGGKTPSVSFGLKPVYLDANVSDFTLHLDGQKFRYRHGPARVQQAQWPGPDSAGKVRIIFEDNSGARVAVSKEGPWAWFRVLDRSDMKSVSADRLQATFKASGRKASWEIRASSVVNPFMMEELQQFRCPGRL